MQKKTYIGMGYRIDEPYRSNRKKVKPLYILDSDRKGHLFCFGTTRVGKTRLIELMVEQDIRKGYNVVVLDPKLDIDLFSKIVQVALETNRLDDLILVNPIFPECSATIDPLSHYYMPEEVVNHVVSGIRAREEFFINIAYETTLSIVLSLLLFSKTKGKPYAFFNFEEIKKKASYKGLQTLANTLKGLKGTEYQDEAEEIIVTLDQILGSPIDYFSKVSSSLRTVLTALSTGNIGKIVGKAKSNVFIDRLEQGKKVIMVVQSGALLTRKASDILNRVILSMIQSFVGRKYASGRKIDPPLCVYVDEASNVLYVGVEDLFNKAGGAGVWLHGFTQSIADLDAEIGQERARKILDNTNTKIFMKVNDNDTAEYISIYSGIVRKFSPILSLGGGMTVREMEEPLVRPEEIQRFGPREILFFSFDGKVYRGITATVSPLKLKVKYPEAKVAV